MNKFLCTTLIVLAASSAAHAEDLYLGANVSPGKGKLKLSDGTGQADRDANKNSVYAGVFAGYVLSPSWALEAGYRGLGNEYTFDFPTVIASSCKPSVPIWPRGTRAAERGLDAVRQGGRCARTHEGGSVGQERIRQ
jgi:hypothetical protein